MIFSSNNHVHWCQLKPNEPANDWYWDYDRVDFVVNCFHSSHRVYRETVQKKNVQSKFSIFKR